MKLLVLLVLVAVTVLAIFFIVKAVQSFNAKKLDRWEPDILTEGDHLQVILVRPGREPIMIEQPIDKNQDPGFRSIEIDNAWDSAVAIAEDMNKR